MKVRRPKRYLYTPHLSDDNVRKLYQLARAKNLPMTRLLNQLVRAAMEHEEGETADHHAEA